MDMHATNSLRLVPSLCALALVIAACGGSVYSVGTDQNPEQSSGGTTSSGGGGSSGGGAACTTDADCGSGHACAFPSADACNAKGKCFDISGIATCAMYGAGCACDGSEINIACQPFPQGYFPKPLLHTGACTGGGADASAPCVTSKDCPTGYQCGYPEADGCSAKGTCFAPTGAQCNAAMPGCACDGTVINIICLPLPDGYVLKPLLHTGQCADGGK
jgi:hypothetical protein